MLAHLYRNNRNDDKYLSNTETQAKGMHLFLVYTLFNIKTSLLK